MSENHHIPVAFVCAPYRSDTDYGRMCNIERARQIAVKLWTLKYAVVCPHTNTAFFSGSVGERQFLDGYVEILKRCDLLVFDDSIDATSGMVGEIEAAVANEIPAIPLSAVRHAARFMADMA